MRTLLRAWRAYQLRRHVDAYLQRRWRLAELRIAMYEVAQQQWHRRGRAARRRMK